MAQCARAPGAATAAASCLFITPTPPSFSPSPSSSSSSPSPAPSSSSCTNFNNNYNNIIVSFGKNGGAPGWRFSALSGSRLLCNNNNPSKKNSSRSVRLKAVSERADIFKVLGTLVKVGKEGLDAGTKLVPEVVPRPLAQVGVAIVGFVVITTLLNSLFSTALFIIAIGAVSYFVYFYFNKDERPSGGNFSNDEKSTEKTLEEARKIMDKYK